MQMPQFYLPLTNEKKTLVVEADQPRLNVKDVAGIRKNQVMIASKYTKNHL